MSAGASRTAVTRRFLQALETRDYAALSTCLHDEATMRSVVPPGFREDEGAAAIVERFRRWTEEVEAYAVVESETVEFGDLVRARWIIRGDDPSVEFSPSTFEQTAYVEVRDGQIARLRLACSGIRPLA